MDGVVAGLRFHSALHRLAVLVVTALAVMMAVASVAPAAPQDGMRQMFGDEFNSAGLDTSVWTPGWEDGAETTGPMSHRCVARSNVSQSGDGYLRLRLTLPDSSCSSVAEGSASATETGALVESDPGDAVAGHHGFSYNYGYVEWRAQMPAGTGGCGGPSTCIGATPQLWSMPHGHDFEIDTTEGYHGQACWNTHGWNVDPGTQPFDAPPPGCVAGAPLTTAFHTYGALWTPGGVTFYYDGQAVGTGRAGVHSTASQHFLVMDIINMTGSAMVSAKELDADYVRVWQPDADGDGVPDAPAANSAVGSDDCPAAAGPASLHGCPDTDGDGIVGSADACPTQAGPASNNGCPVPHAMGDYVGDGKADFALYRSAGSVFLLKDLVTGGVYATPWGSDGDTPFTGDFVGNDKNDLVLYRGPGSVFVIKDQQTGAEYVQPYGSDGDRPITGDFIGNGKDELALYRSAGSYFLIKNWAEGGAAGAEYNIPFGSTGDRPILGDFVGSSKDELALYRAAGSYFIFKNWADGGAGGGEYVVPFGSDGDKPISGDFVGSDKDELALYRPAGSYFLIKDWAGGGSAGAEYAIQFGQTGDIPVPADYIGDAKTDIAVFRPSTNELLVRTLGDPTVHSYVWGSPGDIPIVPYGTNY